MIDACPKCGGRSGRCRTETVTRKRYESWNGGNADTDDETIILETLWRCMDCNAYRIPQDASAET